ncbi:MAG: hypothetical protein A2020_00465 [Lentisphaerae bacterium GWF2_45_14]|nr:MAG: hypothetical protein A2020_00465 [Lentisphaerae bacterium GWF2_45_14]
MTEYVHEISGGGKSSNPGENSDFSRPCSKPLRFHLLGTAAGNPTLTESNSATVMEYDNKYLLFDVGDGTLTNLLRQGIKPAAIEQVVVSHWHCDHVLGLYALLHQLKNPKCRLPVAKSYFELFRKGVRGLDEPGGPCVSPEFIPLRPRDSFRFGDFMITAYENDHIWPHQEPEIRREFPSLSFAITGASLRILFSGDLGSQANETHFWELLKQPVDLLIMEAAHLMPFEKFISRFWTAQVRRIVFTHVWRDVFSPDELKKRFENTLHIPIDIANDGDWIELGETVRYGTRDALPSAMKPFRYFTTAEKEAIFATEGIPSRWKAIGPFANPKINGEYAGLKINPEDRLLQDAMGDCNGTYATLEDEHTSWRDLTAQDILPSGLLPLPWFFLGSETTNFAVTNLDIPKTGDYKLLWGSDDGCRLLLDGIEFAYDPYKRGAVKDQNSKIMRLSAGSHRLIAVHDTRLGGSGIYFRICPMQG